MHTRGTNDGWGGGQRGLLNAPCTQRVESRTDFKERGNCVSYTEGSTEKETMTPQKKKQRRACAVDTDTEHRSSWKTLQMPPDIRVNRLLEIPTERSFETHTPFRYRPWLAHAVSPPESRPPAQGDLYQHDYGSQLSRPAHSNTCPKTMSLRRIRVKKPSYPAKGGAFRPKPSPQLGLGWETPSTSAGPIRATAPSSFLFSTTSWRLRGLSRGGRGEEFCKSTEPPLAKKGSRCCGVALYCV